VNTPKQIPNEVRLKKVLKEGPVSQLKKRPTVILKVKLNPAMRIC